MTRKVNLKDLDYLKKHLQVKDAVRIRIYDTESSSYISEHGANKERANVEVIFEI